MVPPPPTSHASTPDKLSPYRRLRLLEARLAHTTVKPPDRLDTPTPTTTAATATAAADTIAPTSAASAVAAMPSPFPIDHNSDSVRSFSSDSAATLNASAAPAPSNTAAAAAAAAAADASAASPSNSTAAPAASAVQPLTTLLPNSSSSSSSPHPQPQQMPQSLPPPPLQQQQQPPNPRRKYAPPPQTAAAAAAAAASANNNNPPTNTPRGSRSLRKRKRQSPAVRRNIDDFFRPAPPNAAGAPSVAQRLVLSRTPASTAATSPSAGSTNPSPAQKSFPRHNPTEQNPDRPQQPQQQLQQQQQQQQQPDTPPSRPARSPAVPPPTSSDQDGDLDMSNKNDSVTGGDDDDDDANFLSRAAPGEEYQHLRAMIDTLKLENGALSADNDNLRAEQTRLRDKNTDLDGKLSAALAENEDLATQTEVELPTLRSSLDDKERALNAALTRAASLERALQEAARDAARLSRELAERASSAACLRLGRPAVERRGTSFHEVWEDGQELRRLETRMREIAAERLNVEQLRKEAQKRKRRDDGEAAAAAAAAAATANATGAGAGSTSAPASAPAEGSSSSMLICAERPGEGQSGAIATAELAPDQEDIYRVRLGALKRSESAVVEQHTRLIKERDLLVRELRRQKDERASQFCDLPVMNGRYQLLNLLGKGGFSEVFKAVDLRDGSYVACKIHQLSYGWSEEKKQNFVRHATREYDIHKSLDHPRVVKLVDIFEINATSFCTVLELCDGRDLDSYLRENKVLPEREARVIVAQVLSGLAYLAEQTPRIIHYDLKPGNILMRSDGGIQITDFGLSKVMEATETTADGMELTSQGAGTMWYLPPECFEPARQARISAKVDVWSTGVIAYQMLYGRKPFGNDQTQEKMFRERTVQHQELSFPTRPAVSDYAKDFVRQCLTRNVVDRPDARHALQHPFVRRK